MTLSTDIGGIEQAPNTRVDTRSPGLTGGAQVGAQIGTMINEHRVNKFNEALDSTTDDVFSTEQEDKSRIAPLTGDADADILLENIYSLEDGIQQSSGSRKSALGLELRKVYDTFATKHPKLRSRLASELTRFERTDPEIAALDLMNTDNQTSAALQAKDLERIKTSASDLGMTPGVRRFGSIEWAVEYARRARNVETKAVNDQILAAQESNQDLRVSDYTEVFQAGMSGEGSDTTETYMEYQEDLATFQLALQDPTQPGAKETITLFNNGRSQQLQSAILGNIASAQRRFNAIPIKYSNQEEYKAARVVMESHVKMLTGFLEGIETNNPSLVQAYETYATAQMIGFEAEHRDVVRLNRQVSAFKDTLALVDDTFGAEGALVKHELGVISVDSIEAMLGRDLGISSGLPSTARDGDLPRTVESRRLDYSAMAQGTLDVTGQGNRTQAGRQKALIESEVITNESEYLRLAGEGELAPERGLALIEAKGVRMVALNQSGALDWTGQKTVIEAYANPDILATAKLAAQVDPSANQVLAEDLGRIQTNYDTHRLNAHIDDLNSDGLKFGNFRVLQSKFLIPNFDDIENGNVTFTVDEKAAWDHVRSEQPSIPWTSIQTMNRVMVKNSRELAVQVSKELKAYAHIEAMHNGSNEANYAKQWDLSFSALGMPREQPETN